MADTTKLCIALGIEPTAWSDGNAWMAERPPKAKQFLYPSIDTDPAWADRAMASAAEKSGDGVSAGGWFKLWWGHNWMAAFCLPDREFHSASFTTRPAAIFAVLEAARKAGVFDRGLGS